MKKLSSREKRQIHGHKVRLLSTEGRWFWPHLLSVESLLCARHCPVLESPWRRQHVRWSESWGDWWGHQGPGSNPEVSLFQPKVCVLNHQGSLSYKQQCHCSLEYVSTFLPTSLGYVSHLVWGFLYPESLCCMQWDCWAHLGTIFPPTLFPSLLLILHQLSFLPSFLLSPSFLPSLLSFSAFLPLSLHPSFLSHTSPLTDSLLCVLGSGKPAWILFPTYFPCAPVAEPLNFPCAGSINGQESSACPVVRAVLNLVAQSCRTLWAHGL